MNTKKTAITIVAAMMAIAMVTVAMAAICDEPCGTKVTQCTDDAPTKDAVYALILPGFTGAGTPAAVPGMLVGYVDTNGNGAFDVDECAYVDTNSAAPIVQAGDVRLCECCQCPANTVVGECTCTGYVETGPLTYTNQRIVGYVDMDVDGVYSLPDLLYLDMDASGIISEGDIRLTEAETFGYSAYSIVVNGDDDAPVPNPAPIALLDPATNAVSGTGGALPFDDYLGFVDSSCDGQWTPNGEDKLYLQQLVLWPCGSGGPINQFDAFVTLGDFRLYMPPGEDCWPDCGTKVMQCDPDAVYAFLIPGISATNPFVTLVPAMEFRWVDTNGNGIFDQADNAYVNTDGAGINVEAGDVRLTECCGCGPNTMVGVCGNCDLSPLSPFEAITQQDVVGYIDTVDAHGVLNGVYDLDDPLYLDIGGMSPGVAGPNFADGVVSPGDIRLTDAFGYDAWSVVVAGDADCPVSPPARIPLSDPVLNIPMTPAVDDGVQLNQLLGFVDSECNYVWDDDADDKLYLQQLVGDVATGFRPVPNNGIVQQFDLFATIGDLRLFIDESKVGPGPGEPCWLECGTKVMECDVDAVYGLTIPGVTPQMPAGGPVSAMQFGFVDKDGNGVFMLIPGSSTVEDCAYIDTNIAVDPTSSTGFRVAVGDIRLSNCCDERPNTVVEECDFDEIGQELTVPVDWTNVPGSQRALVGYVDVNADPLLPGYDVSEPLYLDCGGVLPLYADGMVSPGDIRLTGRTDHGMNYLEYSVVQSQDADYLGSLNSVLLDPKTDIPTIDILTLFLVSPSFNDYLGFRDSNCDGIWDIYGDDELYLQQLVPAPDPLMAANSPQFNTMSTIGDFRIYMPPGPVEDDEPCEIYDTNGTPGIQIDEALQAVTDYFDGKVDIDTALAVVTCYFA